MVKRKEQSKSWLIKHYTKEALYDLKYHRYTFKIVYYDGGVPYGYSPTLHMWAHLYPHSIVPDEGLPIVAEQIYIKKRCPVS